MALSKADRDRAIELRWEAGASSREIAFVFKIGIPRMRKILRQLEGRRTAALPEAAQSTNLLALEVAGKLRRQLRTILAAAGITDLTQLQGRSRREVGLLRGISSLSLATIESLMREAGLMPLSD
jgi:transposase